MPAFGRAARLRGRVEAHFDPLGDDSHLVEALRARAWLHKDPTLQLTCDGDRVEGLSNGWPEGVNGAEYVAEEIDRQRDTYVEKMFASPQPAQSEPEITPSVRRFQEALGG